MVQVRRKEDRLTDERNDNVKERAILVGVEIKGSHPLFTIDDSLDELALLASTAGVEVRGRVVQHLARIDSATFVGSGKLEEIKQMLPELDANMVIFDDELSARHQRELDAALGNDIKVLDRSALILDIFAQHAATREGALQVELAQYEYRLPRLTHQWSHLARQAGGGGGRGGTGGVGLRGPGETQLEVDRREIRRRITKLREELEDVRAHRQRHRAQRERAGMPVVALVGYTNAGKSTLLNRLSGADVYVANQLFATLDTTTRRVKLPSGQVILLSDTVGFIQKLPVTLVAAFRATLEEVTEADLLVHVVDAHHKLFEDHIDVVEDTLAELEASRIPKILVLNKMDLGEANETVDYKALGYRAVVHISAARSTGLDTLLNTISHELTASMERINVLLPYSLGEWLGAIHNQGIVEKETHTEDGVKLVARIPARLAGRLKQALAEKPGE